ncbi:hypothetical protein N9K06_01280 [Omnitrophica bacterium]|nr:hypothetical protein [Candidatus Omnitrophota bacterium]
MRFLLPTGEEAFLYDYHNLQYAFTKNFLQQKKSFQLRRYDHFDAHDDSDRAFSVAELIERAGDRGSELSELLKDPFLRAQTLGIADFLQAIKTDVFGQEDWSVNWIRKSFPEERGLEPMADIRQFFDAIMDLDDFKVKGYGGIADVDLDMVVGRKGAWFDTEGTLRRFHEMATNLPEIFSQYEMMSFFISDPRYIDPEAAVQIFAELFPKIVEAKQNAQPSRSEARLEDLAGQFPFLDGGDIAALSNYVENFLADAANRSVLNAAQDDLVQSLLAPKRLTIDLEPRPKQEGESVRDWKEKIVLGDFRKREKAFFSGLNRQYPDVLHKTIERKLEQPDRDELLRDYFRTLREKEGPSGSNAGFLDSLDLDKNLIQQGVRVSRFENHSASRGVDFGNFVYRITLEIESYSHTFFLKGSGAATAKKASPLAVRPELYEGFFYRYLSLMGFPSLAVAFHKERDDPHAVGIQAFEEAPGRHSYEMFLRDKVADTFVLKEEYAPHKEQLIIKFARIAAVMDSVFQEDRELVKSWTHEQYPTNYLIDLDKLAAGNPDFSIYALDHNKLFYPLYWDRMRQHISLWGDAEIGLIVAIAGLEDTREQAKLMQIFETAYLEQWEQIEEKKYVIETLIQDYFPTTKGESSYELQTFRRALQKGSGIFLRGQKELLDQYITSRKSNHPQRYEKALTTLKSVGQEAVLTGWSERSVKQRERILQDIESVDWEQFDELVKTGGYQIPPVPEEFEWLKPAEIRDSQSVALGEEILRAEGYGMVIGAAGVGSRLQLTEPKGMLPVGPLSQATLYETLLRKNRAGFRHYQKKSGAFPVVIMISSQTEKKTVDYFQSLSFWDEIKELVLFVKSGNILPVVDQNTGKVLIGRNGRLRLSGIGHGDALDHVLNPQADAEGYVWDMRLNRFESVKAADWLKAKKVQYVQFLNIQNPMALVADPWLLGEHVQSRDESGAEKQGLAHISQGLVRKEDWDPNRKTYRDHLQTTVVVDRRKVPNLKFDDNNVHINASPYGRTNNYIVTIDSLVGTKPTGLRRFEKTDIDQSGKRVPIYKFEKKSEQKEAYGAEVVYSKDFLADLSKPGDEVLVSKKQIEHWKKRLQAAFADIHFDERLIIELPWEADYLTDVQLRKKLVDLNFLDVLKSQPSGVWVLPGFEKLEVFFSAPRSEVRSGVAHVIVHADEKYDPSQGAREGIDKVLAFVDDRHTLEMVAYESYLTHWGLRLPDFQPKSELFGQFVAKHDEFILTGGACESCHYSKYSEILQAKMAQGKPVVFHFPTEAIYGVGNRDSVDYLDNLYLKELNDTMWIKRMQILSGNPLSLSPDQPIPHAVYHVREGNESVQLIPAQDSPVVQIVWWDSIEDMKQHMQDYKPGRSEARPETNVSGTSKRFETGRSEARPETNVSGTSKRFETGRSEARAEKEFILNVQRHLLPFTFLQQIVRKVESAFKVQLDLQKQAGHEWQPVEMTTLSMILHTEGEGFGLPMKITAQSKDPFIGIQDLEFLTDFLAGILTSSETVSHNREALDYGTLLHEQIDDWIEKIERLRDASARSEIREEAIVQPVGQLGEAVVARVEGLRMMAIEEMTMPAGVFVDLEKLAGESEERISGLAEELLVLIQMNSSLDVYLHNADSAHTAPRFQKLLEEFPGRVHRAGSRAHLAKKQVLVYLSFSEDASDQEAIEAIRLQSGISQPVLSLYENTGALTVFLKLAEGLTEAELLRDDFSSPVAFKNPDGHWHIHEDALAQIRSQIRAAYAVAWSA